MRPTHKDYSLHGKVARSAAWFLPGPVPLEQVSLHSAKQKKQIQCEASHAPGCSSNHDVYTSERQTWMPDQYLLCGANDHGDPFTGMVSGSGPETIC